MKILKYLLISSIFGLLFVGFFHEINAMTQDLGRHLINGKIILETHSLQKTNFFSYSFPNYPFINHHWLSEVIFYFIFQFVGFNGLLVFTTLVILLAFAIVFFYAFKKNNLIPLSLTSILYLAILFERTDLRPEILSFLFLSIFVVVLYQFREKSTKWIYFLPLIELIWINSHIYFFVGLSLLGLFVLDSFIKKIIPIVVWIDKRGKFPKDTLVLMIVFLVSCLVTLVNPNGLSGALYPLTVFENYGYPIEENQNVFFLWQVFQKPTVPYFAAVSFPLLISLLVSFRKVKPIDWLLSLFFAVLAMTAVRNFPLFVFGTFIIFNQYFSIFYKNLITFLHKRNKNIDLLSEKSIASSLLIICLIVIITFFMKNYASQKSFGFGVETGAEKAADFFISNNLKGPIFNNFDIGSYLDYRFLGIEKVFVDGRPEAYPASFFQNIYIPMQEKQNNFEKAENQYRFNIIFFAYTDQTPWGISFLKQIINNKTWKLIYLDDYAVILVKNNEKNKDLIKKFALEQNSIDINYAKISNLRSLLRLAVFYERVGWIQEQIKTHQRIIEINPNFCPSLYSLAVNYGQQQSPIANLYINRFNANCK